MALPAGGPRPSKRERDRAVERIARSNMRLVASITSRYTPSAGLNREDLFAVGCQGLLCAIQKFDPEKGYRFSTYATNWIRQAVTRALEDTSFTIRVPSHIHQRNRPGLPDRGRAHGFYRQGARSRTARRPSGRRPQRPLVLQGGPYPVRRKPPL